MALPKILIIRLSSIGDLVLCTPAIRCIHEQLDAEVHLLSKRSFGKVLGGNPHLKKIWIYEDEKEEGFKGLKASGFDKVFDMHKNWRSRAVVRALAAASLNFNKINVKKWLAVQFKWDVLPKVHLVDRYFQALEAWGVKDDGKGMDYHQLEEVSDTTDAPYTALVLGAAHATKQIPESKLLEIIQKKTGPIYLIGGPAESRLGEKLVSTTTRDNVINFAGKTNLAQSAWLLDRAELVITPDTGMMHIAAARQKPVDVYWGNTVPEFGMYPYYGFLSKQNFVNHQVDLSCRPCSKIGSDRCPKGHFRCMMMQEV